MEITSLNCNGYLNYRYLNNDVYLVFSYCSLKLMVMVLTKTKFKVFNGELNFWNQTSISEHWHIPLSLSFSSITAITNNQELFVFCC